MNKIIFTLLLFIFSISAYSQRTVGLLSMDPNQVTDGYSLIFPHRQADVFLLNNCGEIVHMWPDTAGVVPGNTAYLLENGDLVKAKRPTIFAGDVIWAGGGGATIEWRDWDNNLKWSMTLNDSLRRLHHDIEVLPNGNILAIAWELISNAEAIANGRDTAKLNQSVLWPDYILEVEPIGTDSFNVVWEWHAWDHLVQNFDSTKLNYGNPADNPGKIDLNWDTNLGRSDWLHANSIDYNADLDHIIISIPQFDEFWIIDHNTTTEEAKGPAGELIYRWGNPAAYGLNGVVQQNFYQHDVAYIDHVSKDHPDYGKISLFNNRVGADYSTVNILQPVFDTLNNEYVKNSTFLPDAFDFSYQRPDSTSMHSTGLSSFQVLENGNKMICVGRFGYTFELNPSNDIVWEYKTPLGGDGMPVDQGDTLLINNNLTFRNFKYSPDYAAFDGRNLEPMGYIQTNADASFCSILLPIDKASDKLELKAYPNPVQDMLTVERENSQEAEVLMFDLTGRQVLQDRLFGQKDQINISALESGIYILRLNGYESLKVIVSRK